MFSWYRKYSNGHIERSESLYETEKLAWRDAYVFDSSEIILVNEEKCTEKNVKTPYQMMSKYGRIHYRKSVMDQNGSLSELQKKILKYQIKEKDFKHEYQCRYFYPAKNIEDNYFIRGIIDLYFNKNKKAPEIYVANVGGYRDNSCSDLTKITIGDYKIEYESYGEKLFPEEKENFIAFLSMVLDDENKEKILSGIKDILDYDTKDKKRVTESFDL